RGRSSRVEPNREVSRTATRARWPRPGPVFRNDPRRIALDGAGGASDNSAMTVQVPRLPFSLDPLIAEARRRARQRRFLLALVAVLVAVAVGGAVFATRSAASLVAGPPAPGCPAHVGAGASYLASTRTGTAAAQRDEERLLCLVVLPQGAQLVT